MEKIRKSGSIIPNLLNVTMMLITRLRSQIKENPENWLIVKIKEKVAEQLGYVDPKDAISAIGKHAFEANIADYALKHADTVFRYTEINEDAGEDTITAKGESKRHSDKVVIVKRDSNGDRYVFEWSGNNFYSKKIKNIDGEMKPTTLLSNIWIDVP